jgi:hypothetical protein
MKSEPKPYHQVAEQGPFLRARVKVYGRTPGAALEAARALREGLSKHLSKESTCYTPTHKGFDDGERRHYAVVVVALGGDRAAEQARLGSFLRQIAST